MPNSATSQPWHRQVLTAFLGDSPLWYKRLILLFLLLNPLVLWGVDALFPAAASAANAPSVGMTITAWLLLLEFIFTLTMALRCYPLQPGGLLALEAVLLGLTTTTHIYQEVLQNFEVVLLLVFMVAGIYFMRDLLLFLFSRLLVSVPSHTHLSLLFCGVSAILSAFLDALTVMAVLIGVGTGFHRVHTQASAAVDEDSHPDAHHDLEQFSAALRGLLMHGAVGTALGGVCTLVGEPQNLLIATRMDWHFMDFFLQMAPVTMPVLMLGLLCCVLLERTARFGYGITIPERVRAQLCDYVVKEQATRTPRHTYGLVVQALGGLLLVVALALHIAPIGLIGLSLIVLLTAFNGVTSEHDLGAAFTEALPFTALLVVFFAVVAVISDQQLFSAVIAGALALDSASAQRIAFFLGSGILSIVSDNVFVATIYINEISAHLSAGTISRELAEQMAVAINLGTNLASMGTPNGQAAFLFLLTSSLAPLIRLSYGRMVWMALPYTVIAGAGGLAGLYFFL